MEKRNKSHGEVGALVEEALATLSRPLSKRVIFRSLMRLRITQSGSTATMSLCVNMDGLRSTVKSVTRPCS